MRAHPVTESAMTGTGVGTRTPLEGNVAGVAVHTDNGTTVTRGATAGIEVGVTTGTREVTGIEIVEIVTTGESGAKEA